MNIFYSLNSLFVDRSNLEVWKKKKKRGTTFIACELAKNSSHPRLNKRLKIFQDEITSNKERSIYDFFFLKRDFFSNDGNKEGLF